MPELSGAERALGYRFRDAALLERCFTHASVTGKENNERLEFLGDAVLELYVTEKVLSDASAREGELTRRRQRYVSRAALEDAAHRLGILSFLQYAGGEDVLRGKTASNLFEAAVGAIYLDGGYAAAAEFLSRTLAEREPENYKSLLQEYVQERARPTPVYEPRAAAGGFVCEVCALGGSAQGSGTTKRAAEQAAAKVLYGKLTQ